jgi:hypothetical protein
MSQMGFFDLSDRYASLDAKQDPLVEIDAAVPWEEFRPALERVWRKPDAERKSRAGRKPMDAVLMFKTLVLSALYNLSDDQIESFNRDSVKGNFGHHSSIYDWVSQMSSGRGCLAFGWSIWQCRSSGTWSSFVGYMVVYAVETRPPQDRSSWPIRCAPPVPRMHAAKRAPMRFHSSRLTGMQRCARRSSTSAGFHGETVARSDCTVRPPRAENKSPLGAGWTRDQSSQIAIRHKRRYQLGNAAGLPKPHGLRGQSCADLTLCIGNRQQANTMQSDRTALCETAQQRP